MCVCVCETDAMRHIIDDVMCDRCLSEWHMTYDTDKVQPPVDVPFDTRCGSVDKFSGQWQLLLKDGCRQSNQSV